MATTASPGAGYQRIKGAPTNVIPLDGTVVAIVKLVDCVETQAAKHPTTTKHTQGDYDRDENQQYDEVRLHLRFAAVSLRFVVEEVG